MAPTPLDAIGSLALVDPQQRTIAIEARGPTVEIGFVDLASLRHSHAAFAGHGGGSKVIGRIQQQLRRADLTLDFRVRGITVARLSGSSRGGLVSRLFGLGDTELHWLGVLRALLRGSA